MTDNNKIQANSIVDNTIQANLTDKLKKGELPSGWYYVEGNRAEGIYAYTAEYLNNMYRPRNGERVIEPVPSYEEWQAKLEENIKLKELLEECREIFYECFSPSVKHGKLYKKIDEVLK